ncbi:hypothetical protein RHGRI_035008 [Rhododendron griersonianum]|uniref:Uncharacterized protein n=1 Tax=Rhododendron griersonianum TaxID=479676 RepID=A0AAV6I6T8_9ERIC|nr:hypothetical protein RHGRI_035008 [Rhododendron griersonianum]
MVVCFLIRSEENSRDAYNVLTFDSVIPVRVRISGLPDDMDDAEQVRRLLLESNNFLPRRLNKKPTCEQLGEDEDEEVNDTNKVSREVGEDDEE